MIPFGPTRQFQASEEHTRRDRVGRYAVCLKLLVVKKEITVGI